MNDEFYVLLTIFAWVWKAVCRIQKPCVSLFGVAQAAISSLFYMNFYGRY